MAADEPARAASLLEQAMAQVHSHALVLMDPQGQILAWLAGSQRLFGYAAAEILGRNVSTLFVPEDVARGIPSWERETAAGSGEADDDRWQLRKDGGRVWVIGATTALRGPAGELSGFAKVMRARTDQKAQVEALERRIAALRSSERQHIEFVSTLAHELRNPLGTIANATAMLERAAQPAPDVRFAGSVIRRQADFMARMVADLLELARNVFGKVTLRREPIVLQELLARSVEACRATIDQRSHLLQVLAPAVPIEIEGDAVRLQQVFVNLIDNAAKYSHERGTIWIKATTEGDEAVVHVRDGGIGIAPELLPRIFELFTQSDGAPHGGLGIGLALVKETVALHGGTVQATSDGAGKGSEFTVRLALAAKPTAG